MSNENSTDALIELADDLALNSAQRWRLAVLIGQLLFEAWQEGCDFGAADSFSEGWRASEEYNADVTWLLSAPTQTEH